MTEDYQGPTPPPELVAQIRSDALRKSSDVLDYELRMIRAAYRAGADQELEACVEWLPSDLTIDGESLRDVRRPQPLSLAEQSLALIDKIQRNKEMWDIRDLDVVRRALERLQELEGGND